MTHQVSTWLTYSSIRRSAARITGALFLATVLLIATHSQAIHWDPNQHVVHSGDFNGDGKADLFLQARSVREDNMVLIGQGDGTFTAPIQTWGFSYQGTTWMASVSEIHVGDYNGDGKDDLLLRATGISPDISVFLSGNAGSGRFDTPVVSYPFDHLDLNWSVTDTTLHVGDFNGDSFSDVLLQPNDTTGEVAIVTSTTLGPVSELFERWPSEHLGLQWAKTHYNIVVGKFNTDSRSDLFLQGRRLLYAEPGLNGEFETMAHFPAVSRALLFADDTGRFTQSSNAIQNDQLGVHWSDCHSVFYAGDFNGDGLDDLLQQSRTAGTQRILQSNGSGGFTTSQSWTDGQLGTPWSADEVMLLLGDIQGDRLSDILLQNKAPGSVLQVASNNGGSITPINEVITEEPPQEAESYAVGKIKGTFSVSPSGSATYTIPIDIPPGIGGLQPNISLVYDSQSPNGYIGRGWSISGLSTVSRCHQTYAIDGLHDGIRFDNTARYCLDGQRLVTSNGEPYYSPTAEFRTERDSFVEVKHVKQPNESPEQFIVETKSKLIKTFSKGPIGTDELGKKHQLFWPLTSVEDPYGNRIDYEYIVTPDNSELHIQRITYGKAASGFTREIVFEYENSRPDPVKMHVGPYKIEITKRLKTIRTLLGGHTVREYRLMYDPEGGYSNVSRLTSVADCGFDNQSNSICKKPTRFSWSRGESILTPSLESAIDLVTSDPTSEHDFYINDTLSRLEHVGIYTPASFSQSHAIDITGDGISDFVYPKGNAWVVQLGGNPISGFEKTEIELYSNTVNSKHATPIDYNADGFMDLLIPGASTWQILQSKLLVESDKRSVRFEPIDTTVEHFNYKEARVLDFNGDGLQDFITVVAGNFTIRLNSPDGFQPRVLTSISAGTTSDFNLFRDSVVIDFDGDGKQELLLTGRYKSTIYTEKRYLLEYIPEDQRTTGPIYRLSDVGINHHFSNNNQSARPKVVDFNGDGLPDLAYMYDPSSGVTRNRLELQLNTGRKFEDAMVLSHDLPGIVTVTDWNSDGYGDVLLFTGILGDQVFLGNPASKALPYSDLVSPLLYYDYFDVKYVDINGDGVVDVLWGSDFSFDISDIFSERDDIYGDIIIRRVSDDLRSKINDVIVEIKDGFGALTNVTYKPLTDSTVYTKSPQSNSSYPTRSLIRPIYVVSDYSISNGIGSVINFNYQFHDLRVHTLGRGMLGFTQTTETNKTTGDQTITEYATTQAFDNVAFPELFPYRGLILRQEKWIDVEGSLRLASKLVNEPRNSSPSARTFFSYIDKSTEERYDPLRGGDPISTTITMTDMDQFGNVRKVVQTAIDNRNQDEYTKTTENQFINPNPQIDPLLYFRFGLVTRTDITNELKTTTHSDMKKRSTAYTYNEQLYVESEIREPDDPNYYLKNMYTYDEFGNRRTQTTSDYSSEAGGNLKHPIDQRTNTIKYSGLFTLSPTIEKSNDLGHIEKTYIDGSRGVPLTIIDPNDLTTDWEYDHFGRRIFERRPDGTSTNIIYEWCDLECPEFAVYSITTKSTNSAPVTMYFDQLNREIRTKTIAFDGKVILKDTGYNKLGYVFKETKNYFIGTNPDLVSNFYFYDDLGRLDRSITSDGTKVKNIYVALKTQTDVTRINSLNQEEATLTTIKERNVVGQLSQVIDDNGDFITYQYNAHGDLERIQHPGYAPTSPHNQRYTDIDYDLLSRKIGMDDPDLGSGWVYEYDALGNLRLQTDANGETTTFEYDTLNRIRMRHEPKEGLTKWCYDASCDGVKHDKAIGKLVEEEQGKKFHRLHAYDLLGYPKEIKTTIGSEAYIVSNKYETGQLRSTTYPASKLHPKGVTIDYDYSPFGYLERIRLANEQDKSVWQLIENNADLNAVHEVMENGVITTQRTYELKSGRIKEINTYLNPSNPIQKLSYVFDSEGNLIQRGDTNKGIKENSFYDELNRLIRSEVTDAGATRPRNFRYNNLGNLIQKDGSSIVYGDGNNIGIHAVMSSRFGSYQYDKQGNMKSGAGRTINWSTFNKPILIQSDTNKVTFEYGPERARFEQIHLKNGVETKTHYIGRLYEKIVINDVDEEHKYYVYAGDRAVAIYTSKNSSNQTLYLHQDHIGSIDVITDSSGNVIEQHSFAPFGERRDSSNWLNTSAGTATNTQLNVTTRGFTGHEQLDSVGLVHMNGRVYDPTIGRFLSPDPFVQSPDDIQSYNRYTYANNNPLSFTDPTGYMTFGDPNFVGPPTREQYNNFVAPNRQPNLNLDRSLISDNSFSYVTTDVDISASNTASIGRAGLPNGFSNNQDSGLLFEDPFDNLGIDLFRNNCLPCINTPDFHQPFADINNGTSWSATGIINDAANAFVDQQIEGLARTFLYLYTPNTTNVTAELSLTRGEGFTVEGGFYWAHGYVPGRGFLMDFGLTGSAGPAGGNDASLDIGGSVLGATPRHISGPSFTTAGSVARTQLGVTGVFDASGNLLGPRISWDIAGVPPALRVPSATSSAEVTGFISVPGVIRNTFPSTIEFFTGNRPEDTGIGPQF